MAPCSLMTASVSLLAKSFSVFSCTSTLARCTGVLPAAYFNTVKCFTTQIKPPPKRPLNGYMRYYLQQKSLVMQQNPESKSVDIVRKIAHQWRMLSPEQKQPFQEASLKANEQFKLDIERYKAQLTPAQLQQQALEKRQRMTKRKAIRRKKELTNLGKPKRPRSAFNIFMSEHFQEASGATLPAKMKSLMDDWKNLFSHQKQIYTQLAEDDKIRYKNEMKAWEDHMVEIGREDLLRDKTRAAKKKLATKSRATKKIVKKAKPAKEAAAKGKSKTTAKTKKISSVKTVPQGSTKKT
ncbi:transcription factor A, mitochondrial [Mugil cephalus]|uniref:transcription factor A, mitochondrial n=1 Tax=Mugil cephalus TaxID=48193 RepID=UPI001FB6602A|nr:transcription factor A, mitochondrial [Mugil cephalus]